MKLQLIAALVLSVLIAVPATCAAWEPTKPIEFVVPAGTGGGADQMARLIAGIAEKNKLSPRPLIAINKSGCRRRGISLRQGKKGRSPRHRHYAFQFVHHPPAHRRAVQLERFDADGETRTR